MKPVKKFYNTFGFIFMAIQFYFMFMGDYTAAAAYGAFGLASFANARIPN